MPDARVTGLSPATLEIVHKLFPPNQWEQVTVMLTNECGNNLPFLEDCDAEELDRYRTAALELSKGRLDLLQDAVKLAKSDWGDLLMAAGFGEVNAHLRWKG